MKRWLSILLIITFCLIPIVSFGAHVPLNLKSKSVYLPDDSDVELVSYNLYVRIMTGYSSFNADLVVKNPNPDEGVSLLMGIPIQIDKISKVRDLSAVSDGKSLKIIQRSSLKNPPSEKEIDVSKWFTWDISLEPGESKSIGCYFSLDNKLELDGTEIVSFPLALLENWEGDPKNIQIIADLDFYGPYVFDPPSSRPVQYDDMGRLTYRWAGIKSAPSLFELSFKPTTTVITRYISEKSQLDKGIKAILDAYKNRSFYKAIDMIHDYLADFGDTDLLSELKYLEALSYQNLFELDKALNLFNQLEPNPGFEGSLSQVIKNKIIYDKVNILEGQADGDKKAFEYLDSLDKPDNYIFSLWFDKKVSLLTPPPIIEEKEPEDIEPPDDEADEEDALGRPKVIDKITIGQYEFYIEEILMMVLALIIIVFIIASIIRRRRKKRSSFFRY